MQQQNINSQVELSAATKRAILYITLAQGILLLGIHELIDRAWWPATSMPLLTLWYTLSLALPTAAWLLIRDVRDKRFWVMLLGYGVLLVPMALYTGSQFDPSHNTEGWALFAPYVISQVAIWFVLTFFMNLSLDGESIWQSSQDVCAYTWRHGLALGLLAAFLGILWMLLYLWGALFKVLNIGFFQELFENRRFIYPMFGLAGGFAVIVLRGQIDAVGLLERIASALLRVLLPLLTLIALLFLFALPFTGVQLLWKAGLGTALMMWLVSLMLLFVNVGFHGDQSRYPSWLRLPIFGALVLLPIYLGLCAWGMWLRIADRGLSLERLWAVVVLLILTFFVVSYSLVIIRRRGDWLDRLPHINKAVGAVVAALLILTSLPILNLPSIAANNQADRLLSGKVQPADFDYAYLRFKLGEPGYRELLALQGAPFMASHPSEVAKISDVLKSKNYWQARTPVVPTAASDVAKKIAINRRDAPVPPELWTVIAGDAGNEHCFAVAAHCELIAIDIKGNRSKEYILFSPDTNWYGAQRIYGMRDGKWEMIASFDTTSQKDRYALLKALESGAYTFVTPEFPDLVIGDARLQIRSTAQCGCK